MIRSNIYSFDLITDVQRNGRGLWLAIVGTSVWFVRVGFPTTECVYLLKVEPCMGRITAGTWEPARDAISVDINALP